jgi:hypothetical protein
MEPIQPRRFLPASFFIGTPNMTNRRKHALVQALQTYYQSTGIRLGFDDVWEVLQHRHLNPDPDEMLHWVNLWFTAPQLFISRFCDYCKRKDRALFRWTPRCPHVACWSCYDMLVTDAVMAGTRVACPQCSMISDPRCMLETLNFTDVAKRASARSLIHFMSYDFTTPTIPCPSCGSSCPTFSDPNKLQVRCPNSDCALEFCKLCGKKPFHYNGQCQGERIRVIY